MVGTFELEVVCDRRRFAVIAHVASPLDSSKIKDAILFVARDGLVKMVQNSRNEDFQIGQLKVFNSPVPRWRNDGPIENEDVPGLAVWRITELS